MGRAKVDSQSPQESWPTASPAWKSRFREGRGFEPRHPGNPHPGSSSCLSDRIADVLGWAFHALDPADLSPLAPSHSSQSEQRTAPNANASFIFPMLLSTPFLYLPQLLTKTCSSKPGSSFTTTGQLLVLELRA